MIAGQGRQWQRTACRWIESEERERQQSVFKHFAIVEHFLLCTKSGTIGTRTVESFIKAMADIEKLNWISFLRCSIMTLSPLFSSKDRFSPLPQRAFFCPSCPAAPNEVRARRHMLWCNIGCTGCCSFTTSPCVDPDFFLYETVCSRAAPCFRFGVRCILFSFR
jgi:hypothetical protein